MCGVNSVVTRRDPAGIPIGYLCGYEITRYFSDGTIKTSTSCQGFTRAGTPCTAPKIFNPSTGSCELPIDNPKNPPGNICSTVGNPINFITGNKVLNDTDYSGVGSSSLQFTRHYNSARGYRYQATFGKTGTARNSIGVQWTHNYYQGLTVAPNTTSPTEVKYTRADGQTFSYRLVSGAWQTDADVDYRLSEIRTADNVRTGWKIVTPNDITETYSIAGDLLLLTDRTGLSQTLTYSCKPVSTTCPVATPLSIAPYAGLLINVTDSYNHSLNFTYNNSGQMATFTDPGGNITRYGYDADGNLSTVTYPDDTPGDTPGDLSNNFKKIYIYGELVNTANVSQPHALTGIIDEKNVRYATYKYDATGRAVSTEHATGGINKYTLTYNADGSTSVTDPFVTVRTTQVTTILGVVKSTGSDQPGGPGSACPAAASAISYSASGNITRRTDFNGNSTCYAYNARNLETVRLEGRAPGLACPANLSTYPPAAGSVERKITTEWHPTWRVPTTIAEPERITTLVWGDTDAPDNSPERCGANGVLCQQTQAVTHDFSGSQGTDATTFSTRT